MYGGSKVFMEKPLVIKSYDRQIGSYKIKESDYCICKPYITKQPVKKAKIEDPFHEIDSKLLPFIKKSHALLTDEFPVRLNMQAPTDLSMQLSAYCELTKINFASCILEIPLVGGDSVEIFELFNVLYTNSTEEAISITIDQSKFILPRNSRFILSDYTILPMFLKQSLQKYDLVTMDPPWFNQSAARGSKYSQLDCFDLLKLPIPQIVTDNGLVCVWVSNNVKYHRFVVKKLFKRWELEVIGQWVWLKVTCDGEAVIPFDSTHRKPYEVLYIGRKKRDKAAETRNGTDLPEIPATKVIVSIPSKHHSRKPDIADIFDEYLPINASKLELFARFVSPGFTCWGNETLLFNQESALDKIDF